MDTPETVDPNRPVECYGPEASAYNTQLIDRKTVYLEKDVSETDQYGRLLRYVCVDVDGLMVNAELLRLGYARVATYPPDVKYVGMFVLMQGEAGRTACGLWGPVCGG